MTIDLTPEDQQKAEALVASGRFKSVEDALHAGLQKIEREEQYKSLVKEKIAKGLDDIAAGRTVSREEFLAEIKERRRLRA